MTTKIEEPTLSVRAVSSRLPDPIEEPTLSVERYAAIMGLGVRNVYNMLDRGDVPSIRVGYRRIIPTKRALAALYDFQ
jgi:hypothetical protein